MEELRSQIRAAFEKDQAAHPPASSLRRNFVEAMAVQPRRKPNLQWVAVAAAAILGILVVAGLMSTRLGHRASVPAATPQAGPLKDYGPPPADVPLVYVIDPRNMAWLQAYDWQGRPRGTVKLALPVPVDGGYPPLHMAPRDGSGFVYQPKGEAGGFEYLDRLGQPIAPGLIPPEPLAWADDNRHLCVVRFETSSGEWRLFTKLPGEADHLVGILPSGPNIDETAISVASCSFRNDQAILVRTTFVSPPAPSSPLPPWRSATIFLGLTSQWVVRISDGKVLSVNTYSNSGSVADIVASSDSLFIAENWSRSTGQPGAGAPSTIIRRVSDRSVVASLDPSVAVLAFNGDDSLELVGSGLDFGPVQQIKLSVIDVRSGQALPWHYQSTSALVGFGFMAQPGGRDFALALTDLGPAEPGLTAAARGEALRLSTILIIHGDGSVTKLGAYVPTW